MEPLYKGHNLKGLAVSQTLYCIADILYFVFLLVS